MKSAAVALICVALGVAGCGGGGSSTSNRQSSTVFRPAPYSVRCVIQGFAKAGVSLVNLFPGLGNKHRTVILDPDETGGLKIEVTVRASPRDVGPLMAQVLAVKKFRPEMVQGFRMIREGNLFISYRDRPEERRLIRAGVSQLRKGCVF